MIRTTWTVMKRIPLIFLVVLTATPACVSSLERREQATIDLFNGEDLAAWNAYLVEPGVAKEDVWSVRDGILICQGQPMGYLYTDRLFEDFRLEVQWRWPPSGVPGNSGVLIRINGPPMALPRCIEAQLKHESAGDLYGFHGMTVNAEPDRKINVPDHDLGGHLTGARKFAGNEKLPGLWNTLEVLVDGGNITVHVNDLLVNEATDCEIAAGPIGLQSEGGEIQFRRVRITPLAPGPNSEP